MKLSELGPVHFYRRADKYTACGQRIIRVHMLTIILKQVECTACRESELFTDAQAQELELILAQGGINSGEVQGPWHQPKLPDGMYMEGPAHYKGELLMCETENGAKVFINEAALKRLRLT